MVSGFPINSSCTYFWVDHIISGSFFFLNCQALRGKLFIRNNLNQLGEWLRVTWCFLWLNGLTIVGMGFYPMFFRRLQSFYHNSEDSQGFVALTNNNQFNILTFTLMIFLGDFIIPKTQTNPTSSRKFNPWSLHQRITIWVFPKIMVLQNHPF